MASLSFVDDDDDDDEERKRPIAVPEWMKSHSFYPLYLAQHAYQSVHAGQVNIPGLTKGSRIVSMKVPPMYHSELDGIDYTV